MYPRRNYEMTEADKNELLEDCKPVTYMVIGGHEPRSQQENANDAWVRLGRKMGFEPMTVEPAAGGMRFFTAVPSETEDQQKERMEKESEQKRQSRIKELQAELIRISSELSQLIPV